MLNAERRYVFDSEINKVFIPVDVGDVVLFLLDLFGKTGRVGHGLAAALLGHLQLVEDLIELVLQWYIGLNEQFI